MERIYLNNDWQFSEVFDEAMIRADFKADGMTAVRIPHTCRELPYNYFDEKEYQMVSGYRRILTVPEDWKGHKLLLTFEGVGHYCVVYLNGTIAGTHNCGYSAFTLDISDLVSYGEDNLIALKVDSREELNTPPFGFVIDYMTYGGIYRDVYLEVKNPTYIKDIIFVVAITLTCTTIKEKSTVDVDSPSVSQMFKALLCNDQAMVVVITIVLINCALYITSNLLIYFFKYDFGGETWYNSYTLFNTFGGAIQILSMMLFFPLMRKALTTTQVFFTGMTMAITGYATLLVLMICNINNIFLLFIPGFLVFTAFGLLTVLTTVFLANTVDYGELKNNRRDESVIFSMQTFVVKLASGISALIASICLSVFNISDNTDNVAAFASATSVLGLRMTMTLLPIIGFIIALLVFKKRFILTEAKVDSITKELKERQ